MMKKIVTLIVLIIFPFQKGKAQDNFLWATGSTVGSYYNAAGYYTNNFLNPWPYSRSSMIPIVIGNEVTWKHIESSNASQSRSVGVKTDGTIWFWMKNSDPTKSAEPIQFGTDTDWKQGAIANASAYGGYHGLKNNGTLWFMMNHTATPVQWGTDNDWDTIVGWMSNYIVAIKTNGTLWKLETDTDGEPLTMTQFGTDTDWLTAKVTSNGTFSYALKTNGTLWKFNTSTSQFDQEGTDTDWKDITDNGFIALKTNGSIWGQGVNFNGVLGLGHTNTVYEFTQIGSDTDWTKISSLNTSTYAIKADSTLWAWGANASYQLANGNNTEVHVPTQVGQDHSWLSVSAATTGAYAIRTYGYAGPNGGSTVGISNQLDENSSLKIYPNPTKKELTILSNASSELNKVLIYDLKGVLIKQQEINNSTEKINLEFLAPGTYILQVNDGQRVVFSKEL